MIEPNMRIAFFGGEPLGVAALEALAQAQMLPTLIVCNPDRPQGRNLVMTPPPVKVWAMEHGIETFQPESLSKREALGPLVEGSWDLFIVVAYGSIIPKDILSLPSKGTINVHPSLLPELRGASPIRTSLLRNLQGAGVSIMLMDEKMDHGPILASKPSPIDFPIPGRDFDALLAEEGASLLTETIPRFLSGEIIPTEQDHSKATYTEKISKQMGELQLDPFNLPQGKDAYDIYLKICAYDGWPSAFFFYKDERIKITKAHWLHEGEGALCIVKVIPEGKKEMDFDTFLATQS